MIAPHGLRNVARLVAIVRDESDTRLPDLARQVLQVLATQLEQLMAAVAAIEQQLTAWHRSNPVSQRLASIPGVGPIIATALAATVVEPIGFASGREFAAWLGLVPRQHSTGGKVRLGGISKRGNRYLRRLLINGEGPARDNHARALQQPTLDRLAHGHIGKPFAAGHGDAGHPGAQHAPDRMRRPEGAELQGGL